MSRTRISIAFISFLAFAGALSLLRGQTPGAGVEQQLRSQLPLTLVGANGVVVREGTVLVVQQDGINALPAPAEWPCNSYKPGSRIKQSTMCAVNYSPSKDQARLLQVGEKAYLTAIQFKPAEVVFRVQTCPGDSNEAPVRAAVSFQFQKGFVGSMDVKQVRNTIDAVFGIDTPSAPVIADPGPPPPAPVVPLKLPATYVSAQTQTDQLQLKADNSFSLQEGGQPFHGNFAVNGNNLELHIIESDTKTTATIQGNNLTDSSGQTWVLRVSSAGTAPAAAMFQNEDVIKMAKAGLDDTIIIAKIGGSKCQFDTSPDALIRLKQGGVSAAVLKAMLAAGK